MMGPGPHGVKRTEGWIELVDPVRADHRKRRHGREY
jgi:hypothetical protein